MSRRPQVPQSNVPNRRPRRPQAPQPSQSLVPREERRGRPQSINQLAVAEPPPRRGAPSALVPHKPRKKQSPNALVAYEEPDEPSYHDEYYEPPPARPLMAQFCQPRCCILLLLVLFFGLLLLIAIILLVMSIDKGDPEGIAGWTYPIPARDPNGYSNDQAGDKFGTALDSAGEFLIISCPERQNPNGSRGAVFMYVWLGSYWAVYGNDGILTPPDVDYEPNTWVNFYKQDQVQTRKQKEANRVHFDNDSKNAVKWADNGDRVAIGVPSKNSVVLYQFTHPLKESDYMESLVVEGPYQDAGRNIAISADGNRVAVTALYNETLANMTNITNITAPPAARYLDEIMALNMTNTTNTTNITLPGVVLVYDYDEQNKTWYPATEPIVPQGKSAESPEHWGDNMVMSFDGSTIAVSNPSYEDELGIVDVYRIMNATNGTYEYSTTWEGDVPGGKFGYAMASSADGRVIAVSAPFFDKGNVAVFEFNEGSFEQNGQIFTTQTWSQKGFTVGDDPGEWFGYDVDMAENGNSMVVGAPKGNGGIGKMIIFDFVLGRWYPYTDMPQKDQYGKYQGSGNYGSSVAMTNNGDSITIGAPNHTAAEETMDYVEFFDKSPKGMNLTGRTRPAHVLAEHPDGYFGR
ncbi:unnamed protein product [Cylindrotheca closterium]|uniref:Uncharacterized protein n=1 Tax=Cylindrotheca closterium TaxID=2856 RepID=A0AAD2FPW0_9STRA|nr:unnamed protein product [Cylindrotheca closterium]